MPIPDQHDSIPAKVTPQVPSDSPAGELPARSLMARVTASGELEISLIGGSHLVVSRDGITTAAWDSGLKDEVIGASFNEDGSRLAVASFREIKVFSLEGRDSQTEPVEIMSYRPFKAIDDFVGIFKSARIPRLISHVALSPDGSQVSLALPNNWAFITSRRPSYGMVELIDVNSAKRLDDVAVPDSPSAIEYTSNDSLTVSYRNRPESHLATREALHA